MIGVLLITLQTHGQPGIGAVYLVSDASNPLNSVHEELNSASPADGMSLPLPELRLAPSIWNRGMGEGFRSSVQSIGLGAGNTYGLAAFGGKQAHHLAMACFAYGHMLGGVLGEDRFYRGNFEFRLELFTGGQYSPDSEWFAGLTPELRYVFATGSRWAPFVEAGAGGTADGIRSPDLSGTFEFNLLAGVGVQWFVRDNVALGLESRYVHWSCAGLSTPNRGLNGVAAILGVIFYF